MKRLLLIIGIMAAVTANAQNFSRHTFHWGDGTSTSVTTIGSHTYVKTYSSVSDMVIYDAFDSIGNVYTVGMHTDLHYKVNGHPVPSEGIGYTVYTREYDMDTRQVTWTEVGRLTIEDTAARKMTFDITGEITHDTYIVYDEYLDYFIDKNVNKLSTRRLKKKYGYGFVTDCDIAVILKK